MKLSRRTLMNWKSSYNFLQSSRRKHSRIIILRWKDWRRNLRKISCSREMKSLQILRPNLRILSRRNNQEWPWKNHSTVFLTRKIMIIYPHQISIAHHPESTQMIRHKINYKASPSRILEKVILVISNNSHLILKMVM